MTMVRLGDCGTWMSGGTPSKSRPEFWTGSIPWVSAKSLHRFFVENSDLCVSEMAIGNGTRIVPEGTILFIVRGMSLKTEFRMGITTRPVAFNQDLKAICPREGILPRYLAYALKSATPQVLGMVDEAGHGTGRLQTDLMMDLPLRVPPLPEQRGIAEILGALDDKIELNRKMNQTLEEMAQAIFKSWFIDFDGHTEFVDSELGKIPKGWRVSRLGEHFTLQRGNTYKSKLLGGEGPYLLGLASIQRNGGFRRDKLRRYSGESAEKILVHPGDLFVALKDVTQAADLLGSVARVPSDVSLGRMTQDTVKLVPMGPNSPMLTLYYLMLTPVYREYCRGRATGTTNLGLARDDFLSFPFAMPDNETLNRFNASIECLHQRAEMTHIESKTLAQLRDILLPKLISGELRVPDAKKAVEDVA